MSHNSKAATPLYVRVPDEVHSYLERIKDETGLTKSDITTLILEISRKYITDQDIKEMFLDYTVLGYDGLTPTENLKTTFLR